MALGIFRSPYTPYSIYLRGTLMDFIDYRSYEDEPNYGTTQLALL